MKIMTSRTSVFAYVRLCIHQRRRGG